LVPQGLCGGFLGLSLLPPAWHALVKPGHLQIYFVDVRVGRPRCLSPRAGQSLLIDTGWSGMMAAMQTVSWLRPEGGD